MNKVFLGLAMASLVSYQIGQPVFLIDQLPKETVKKSRPHVEQWQEEQVIIEGQTTVILQKANTKESDTKKEKTRKLKSTEQLRLEILQLERSPKLDDGNKGKSLFAQQLKSLSGTVLYGAVEV
ncbi:hypothetical protein [Enterococcus phoeniculicola]|uniref:Uncharacterized protein n=1 Tax=Enterococcus phoeniculicola ATCC BAA-412 TaxID=1158610 RepID=R3TVS5_9ENTE|nr:hypothetical protein [Enterococcus phoeniculicola]EOL45253.1 hypothetical protein UC3_01143 [Enterococcus phoeniculicola ATCC BAA-412]EOT74615.1 hypothetical protein I589_02215 [Enterococcus phoeniculicola ATCC BAA-412]